MLKRHMPSMTSLQCFEAAARHLSFTLAARELNLTQSAISKQVAQLERQLQRSLFRRVRRRLQLTPEGSLYLQEVRKILAHVEMSTRQIVSYAGRNEVLRVATLPTFGARWLIPRLNGFRHRHPSIFLDMCNKLEPFDLLGEAADVAFSFGHGAWPAAECIRLLDEEVVPVCSPNILPPKPLGDPMELTDLVLLQNATRPEAWHDWFASLDRHTEHSYHGPRFDTFDMAMRAARVGCGVALVPRFLADEELSEGKLVVPWNHSVASENAYYLAYPEHAAEVPKLRAFVDWVLEHRELPVNAPPEVRAATE
jgi:DNA-binding transcriptional LysR family regulator